MGMLGVGMGIAMQCPGGRVLGLLFFVVVSRFGGGLDGSHDDDGVDVDE